LGDGYLVAGCCEPGPAQMGGGKRVQGGR
jgi:hypothetical protein